MLQTKLEVEQFLETADVARVEGVVPATVRADVKAGRLRVSAVTPRGTRLFRPKDVEEYRRARHSRAARRNTSRHEGA